MSKLNNNEPSLERIDDYNGNESKQKRNIVRLVVIFCLIVGGIFTYLKKPEVYHVEIQDQPKTITK